jgi:hypothetical protein
MAQDVPFGNSPFGQGNTRWRSSREPVERAPTNRLSQLGLTLISDRRSQAAAPEPAFALPTLA